MSLGALRQVTGKEGACHSDGVFRRLGVVTDDVAVLLLVETFEIEAVVRARIDLESGRRSGAECGQLFTTARGRGPVVARADQDKKRRGESVRAIAPRIEDSK